MLVYRFYGPTTGQIDSDIVNLGAPKSKMDKQRVILGIIQDLVKKDGLAEEKKICDEAVSHNIAEIECFNILEILSRAGQVVKPKTGSYKLAYGG